MREFSDLHTPNEGYGLTFELKVLLLSFLRKRPGVEDCLEAISCANMERSGE